MAEKQEFYRLLNDKTKVPRLTNPPQLNNLKNDLPEKDLLHKFRTNAMKLIKSKPPQSQVAAKWRTSVNRVSKSYYTEELIKLAKTIPIQGLLPEWEQQIFKLIPKANKRKYFTFLMNVMKEVRQEYYHEMQNFSVKSIVNTEDEEVLNRKKEEETLKRRDLNEDFSTTFDANRKIIFYKYFLSHRLIRCISNIMYYNLPKSFINFERYKKFKDVHIFKLREMINNDLQRCSSIVQDQCYNEIIKCMLQMTYLKNDKRLPKLLHCAESFMAQKILNVMMKSINNLIKSLKSPASSPQLKLHLICKNNKLEIDPSIDDIYATYHGIINNVSNMAQDLVPFGEWLKINDKTQYVKVRLPDWFLKESHERLQEVLRNNFQSLCDYYDSVSSRLSPLCSKVTKMQVVDFVSEKREFEVYCSEVDKYNNFLSDINAMVENDYYSFGILNQTHAINDLKQKTLELKNILIDELISIHQDLNRSICKEFENLESRALDIPDDTKSLFELTDYVSHASKVLIRELEEKIQRSIFMLCSLGEIAILSNEHLDLNKNTINWLELIIPVFSQHNIFCEAKKGELEDELQRKVNLLNAEIDALFPELVIIDDMDDASRVDEYREFLATILTKISIIDNRIEQMNVEEKLFKFPESTFPKVDEVKEVMSSFCSLVHLIYQWQKDHEVWLNGPFEYLKSDIIEKQTEYYTEKIMEMHKTYKLKIKTDQTSNKPFKFTGVADDPDPMQQPAPLKLCWQTLQNLNEFKKYVPLAVCMCNPALQKRHWNEMSTISGINLLPNAGTTLRKMMTLDLLKDFETYEIISIGANNELALQQKLTYMVEEWNDVSFSIQKNMESLLLEFVKSDRINSLLEYQFLEITKMRASYFITPIEMSVIEFQEKLHNLRDTIEFWDYVQEQFKYLNLFFSHDSVQEQLETELDLYKSLNVIVLTIEETICATPTFDHVTRDSSLLEKLKKVKYALELIIMKVHKYFEAIKLEFTRLFFLSDNEILELLFNIHSLNQSYSNIQKCFPNIARLKLDHDQENITAVIGKGGEELKLNEKITLLSKTKCVSQWLSSLHKQIINVIRYKINESMQLFNEEISYEWILSTPAMAIFCIWQILWTSQIQKCFLLNSSENLKDCRSKYQMYKENAQRFLKHNLSRKDREIFTSLIIIFSNQEEAIGMLIEKKIHEESDFDWKAQVRHYYQNGDVKVIILNNSMKYAYEYYSSSQKIIVNTPLTERCYRSLMEASYQNYFGGFIGHSCVGKSETIKNLSRLLAMPFYIFHGELEHNYNCIGNIFKGLVTLEAWVCFKNFTKIKEEMLSLISQYVFRITQSKSMKANSINIHGTQLRFNYNCCMSYIINPSYHKLSELPENLKLHFRTVCMMNPDLDKICQIELYAAGFSNAKSLASLLVEVYNLCNEQMSSFAKYNLKLRSLKSIIITSGKLKFVFPNEDERILLLRSLIDNNIAQFDNNEIVIFQSILNKCFSGVTLPSPNYDNLLESVEKVCQNEKLNNHDAITLKIIQLYELLHLKQSIILVGDSFSGKTTVLKTLRNSLICMHEKENMKNKDSNILFEIINPSALNSDKLYGIYDDTTESWHDGICTGILRRYSKIIEVREKWLVFDSDVHESWVEKFQTSLDDQLFFLTSNERIVLDKKTKIFFETLTLHNISPSIISKCGILHFESQMICWKLFVMKEIMEVEQMCVHKDKISALFNWSIEPCLKFIRQNCRVNLKLTDMHLVMSTLNLFLMYMNNAIEENFEKKEKERDPRDKDYTLMWAQAALIMATSWGLSGNLDFESAQIFEDFLVSLWNNSNQDYPRPIELKQYEIALPSEGNIRDNIYFFKGSGQWKHISETLKIEKIKEDNHSSKLFIPTVDSLKFSILFNLHLKNRKPFILCGESSCGKTSLLENCFENLSEIEYAPNYFNFNSVKESMVAQDLILMKLTKVERSRYKPLDKRYWIIFVDDINIAVNYRADSNSTLEMIRQYMDYAYWYDCNDGKKINISDLMFCGAMTSGRENLNSLCKRFLRHFNVFTSYSQTKENIFRIFSNSLMIDLKKNSFSTDIMSSVNGIVNATIDVFLAIVQELRPTPTKILYQFSLHDVQKIIKGCSLIQKESVETKVTFIRLWAHEIYRVIGDRMINDKDNQWLFFKMREAAKTYFKDPFESVFDYLPKYGNDELTKESFKDLFFGNFMETDSSKRRYEEINQGENLKNKLEQYINEYNDQNKVKMDFIVTCHAIEHIVKISRILITPGGNMLAISCSGSGRKSLVKLATFIQKQILFEPMLDSKSNVQTWKEDIKSIMIDCGSLQQEYTIMLTERQMKSEIAQDINNFLSFGEIPGLFREDERRAIIKTVRLRAQNDNRNLEIEMWRVFNFFLDQCKKNVHFIINITPANKILTKYLCEYPNLMGKCTINWMDNWPDKALDQISTWHMKDLNLIDSIRNQVILSHKHLYNKAKIICDQYYEETGNIFYIVPLAFIRTLKIYVDLITKKQEEIKSTRKRYLTGLDKLQLAAREVAQMKNTLTKLRPQLEASARQTEATMKEIENENMSVEKATVLVKRDEEIANKKAEIASILRVECETELAVAIPILEDALAALNTLKPADITLVKAMKNPPDTVKLVMAAVCVMLNVPAERVVDPVTGRKSMDFWGPSKRVLGDMNFLQNLKDYDKDSIAPTVITTIKKNYISDKTFQPHIVAKASSAAEGLCKWVRAMVSYDEVAKVVAPKKEKLALAQKECDETEAFLNTKRKILADLNMKLSALKSTLETTLAKKVELEKEVESCTVKLKKAEDLITSLGGEKTRWMDSSNNLSKAYDNLPGDVLLASILITYLSPLNFQYREKTIREWKELLKVYNIPFSEDYDFVNFLGIEVKVNTWRLCGLPNSSFSLQNAIIMENSPLWCLFMDPQAQANEWIKVMETPNNIQIVKATDHNFIDIIRSGIELGIPILLENVEDELDTSLEPILSKVIYKISENWYIDIGKDSVVYVPSFRFYLTTRYYKPHYSTNVFNKVTAIDFLLPSDAIQERLLDIIISRERPELQEKFERILMENVNNKRILKQQEDNILHILSGSTTNILEDEVAIRTLDISKSLAVDLIKRQEAVRVSKEEIDAFRESYATFTRYCADLYSTLNILPNLNCMYRFSLSWFTQLYVKSIETSNRSVIHKKRIDYLKMSSIQHLHQSVHNALFERHKLIYSFILCAKTLLDTEQVTEQEFNVFMSVDEKNSMNREYDYPPNPASAWLSEQSWRELNKISSSLPVFQNLASSLSNTTIRWRRYCNSFDNDDSAMPTPWENRLTAFQKLILIRIMCPDRIIFKITEFVESVMGQNTSSFVPCNIARPYAESSCLVPLIFILPSYSSPFAIINRFSKILGYSEKLHSLSMGPSQEQKAELLIEMARQKGEWVFLHNCHLALTWMIKLEKLCESLDVTNTSLGFRLWISAQTDAKFPIGILQNSIKITCDSPCEIKQTLAWTYKSEPVKDKEFFEGCPGKDKAFSKLLYGFCLFHAVIRERKNFGLQSWNFCYDFDEPDLHMSIIQLKNWINQYDKVPFKALSYFLSECNYGGKIMDAQDKVYLDNLVFDYCNFKVTSDSNYDFDTAHAYRVPKRIEFRDYLRHIRNNIPNYTSPDDFGYDKNIGIMKNTNKITDFLNSLSLLNETPLITPSDECRNSRVMSIIYETLEVIPVNFNLEEVQSKYTINELEPLNCVLIEEIKEYNKCLDTIRNCLNELKEAHRGYTMWTEKMELISAEIFRGLVPESWKVHISLCTKKIFSKFITDLLERVKFINSWIENGHQRSYWFGGLMSCKRLLSTLKMSYAKEKQVPVDQVSFEFNVMESKNTTDDFELPKNSISVYGLYLVGAKWNEQTKSLTDSKPKSFYNEVPAISFELTLRKNTNNSNCINIYKCPLYVSPSQHNSQCNSEINLDNFILLVNLKSDNNPKIWIKRGTALYCQSE